MRVIFVNRFYWPAETATAQLLTDLAESLAARGWRPLIITGHSSSGLPDCETRHGVEIVRIGRRMADTQRLRRRAVDFALFHLCALPALYRRGGRHDCFVALTDPPLIGITVSIAAAWCGARTIHWVQDVYPEVVPAVNDRLPPRLLSAVLRWPRNMAWRRAVGCVTLGQQMVAHLHRCGLPSGRIHVIPNWAPRGLAPASPSDVEALRAQWQLQGKFVVAYSGNFGRVHDLRHILDVADRVRDEARIVFLFIGNGAAFAALQQGVAARRLSNVRFLPARARTELSASLGVGDVHLITLRVGCEHLVFPSKLHGIAAVGRPVLLLSAPQSEIARIVREEGLGMVFQPDDVEGIASGLKTFAANPDLARASSAAALRFDAANGGCERAANSWEQILRGSAGAPAIPCTTAPRPAQLAS